MLPQVRVSERLLRCYRNIRYVTWKMSEEDLWFGSCDQNLLKETKHIIYTQALVLFR